MYTTFHKSCVFKPKEFTNNKITDQSGMMLVTVSVLQPRPVYLSSSSDTARECGI